MGVGVVAMGVVTMENLVVGDISARVLGRGQCFNTEMPIERARGDQFWTVMS